MPAKSIRCCIKPLAVAVLIAVPVAVGLSAALDQIFNPIIPGEDPPEGTLSSTPFILSGIRTPPVISADAVAIPDEEPIIGVSAGGHHRAYRIAAMSKIAGHVINDLFGDVPVTITYCDRTDCSRVFVAEKTGQPLDVGLGGYRDGLLLKYEGFFFRQEDADTLCSDQAPESQRLPFKVYQHTRTTWKEWRTLHPDTEVCNQLMSYPFRPPVAASPKS